MSQTINIGLLGCGTVGTGVVKLLLEKRNTYAHRIGHPIQLKKILVRSLEKAHQTGFDPDLFTQDAQEVLADPEIDIVVELMGGIEPAKEYILNALASGKHVVTANKALVALHGTELFECAEANQVSLYLEAAVAGGIPIIQTIKRSLIANQVHSLYGIINGTTNFILSKMSDEGSAFETVLKEAQAKGFAEADPSSDVGGFDAQYKLGILSSLIFGKRIQVDEIHRVGIEHISPRDIELGHQFGYTIKLLAVAKQSQGAFEARVHPTMIPSEHPLASVGGAFNAILMQGDAVGDMMFYGQGAGQMPTASAVVSDILNIASEIDIPPNILMSGLHHGQVDLKLSEVESLSQNSYFIRILTEDKPGVLGQMGTLLGQEGVSIKTCIQEKVEDDQAELIFITHPVAEARLRPAISHLHKLSSTRKIYSVIRVETFKE